MYGNDNPALFSGQGIWASSLDSKDLGEYLIWILILEDLILKLFFY